MTFPYKFRVHLVGAKYLDGRLIIGQNNNDLFTMLPFEVAYGTNFRLEYTNVLIHWSKIHFPWTNDPTVLSLCCEGTICTVPSLTLPTILRISLLACICILHVRRTVGGAVGNALSALLKHSKPLLRPKLA